MKKVCERWDVALIEAQEQKRKRIARELHDSIVQQLAVITLGLWKLQSADNLEPAERAERIKELSQETACLASEVQALSHRIHSSKLDYLGLVPAIRALCREIGEHQQAEIHF